jgi:hypothetical protein
VVSGREKRIYRLVAIRGFFSALAFIIPRFMPGQEGAFGAAGTAILAFLGMLFAAAIVSLYLLLVTVQVYRELSFLRRLAGVAPSVVPLTALAMRLGFLRY